MSDKERSEEIENKKFFDVVNGELLKLENVNRLIEQAERVQELENHLKLYDFWYRTAYEQNKRYREALKNIYELAEYDEYNNTLEQIVSEIEKALEGTK